MTSSVNPSIFGNSVTFTATLSGGAGTPSGPISFSVDGNPQASPNLVGGVASFTTSTLSVTSNFSHNIFANYNGDANYAPAARSLNQTVNSAAGATNVTGSLTITRGGFRMMQATQRFVQSVTIRNNSASAIAAPVSLVLDGLSPNAALYLPAGNTSCTLPAGSPYTTVNVGSDNLLTPGEQVSITLEFVNPTKQGITYTPRVLAGAGCR